MADIRISSHPLVRHHLVALRNPQTRSPEFRQTVRNLTLLLASEATAHLPLRTVEALTPLGTAPGGMLADRVAIVPILRAGLGMADGLLELIPDAEVWHVGLYRDEQTLQPREYYNKLPRHCAATLAIVVDPMLATGGSAARTCQILHNAGISRLIFIALLAAPEGVAAFSASMPDVPVFVGAMDEKLNAAGFIVPGLGDAGDRQFGTSEPADDHSVAIP